MCKRPPRVALRQSAGVHANGALKSFSDGIMRYLLRIYNHYGEYKKLRSITDLKEDIELHYLGKWGQIGGSE